MKRLRLYIIIFCLTLALPLAYFVARTFDGLEQEEIAELDFFAESLFDRMEDELANIVAREEGRAVDEYNYLLPPVAGKGMRSSPLSKPPGQDYILGYLQNGPDGGFQTPLAQEGVAKIALQKRIATLAEVNSAFNRIKATPPPAPAAPAKVAEVKSRQRISAKYLAAKPAAKLKKSLGQAEKRYEEITLDQARNISRDDLKESVAGRIEAESDYDMAGGASLAGLKKEDRAAAPVTNSIYSSFAERRRSAPRQQVAAELKDAQEKQNLGQRSIYKVEVAPLQSMVVDNKHVFIYRRIVLNNRVFRQGLVLKVREFFRHLSVNHFENQPMARFTGLKLSVADRSSPVEYDAGAPVAKPKFHTQRGFPRPFAFISASLACTDIPRSTGRQTLLVMVFIC